MELCESFEKLKALFQNAYIMTKGNPLQQNVQKEYAKHKARLNV